MRLPRLIRASLREPLVAFALAGGTLFAVNGMTGNTERPVIEVDADGIEIIAKQREQVLERRLTEAERAGLAEALLIEEMLVHEAISRGLHLTDAKVRQRLAAKMYFLIDEPAPDPSAADLERLRLTDPTRYLTPELVTFEHLFFPWPRLCVADEEPGGHPIRPRCDQSRERAERALERIEADGTVADAGEIFWLGRRMERYDANQLLTVLGAEFTAALPGMTPGEWSGPVRSGRGWHLVRIDSFHPPEPLTGDALDLVRRQHWAEHHRATLREQKLAELSEDYEIRRAGAPRSGARAAVPE